MSLYHTSVQDQGKHARGPACMPVKHTPWSASLITIRMVPSSMSSSIRMVSPLFTLAKLVDDATPRL
jgi:hypothetical protein